MPAFNEADVEEIGIGSSVATAVDVDIGPPLIVILLPFEGKDCRVRANQDADEALERREAGADDAHGDLGFAAMESASIEQVLKMSAQRTRRAGCEVASRWYQDRRHGDGDRPRRRC